MVSTSGRKKEDLINVGMTGGGGVETLEIEARGCSLLACTFRSRGDAFNARLKDVAEEESTGQRNMTDALALAFSDPRPPSTTLLDLKVRIATFAGLLWTLFGYGCDCYKKYYTFEQP